MSCISEAFWTATNDSARTRMTARDVVINNDGNMLDPVLQCEWLQDAVNPMRIWPFVGGGESAVVVGGRGLHKGNATSCSCACCNPVTWDRGARGGDLSC